MGIGRFKISYVVLEEMLHLPDDARIVNVDPGWPGGTCRMMLE